MRVMANVAVLAMWLASTYPTYAISQQDWNECSGKDLTLAIPACSRIVSDQAASDADRADGYLFRAGAYLSQRNFDLAIADYSEATRLAPRNATAYSGRALALFYKGSRDRAVADYSTANRLDAAKMAEIAGSNPDMAQIAALARTVPASPSATAPTAPKQLPRNIGLSDDVIKQIEENGLFAQAPPVVVATLNTSSTTQNQFDGPFGRTVVSGSGKTIHKVEGLGIGLVKFDSSTNSDSTTRAPNIPPAVSHPTMRRTGLTLGNGLFDANTNMSFQNDGRPRSSEVRLIRIVKTSGKLFPVQINNRFSFTATYKASNSANEFTTESDCVISRAFDAKAFNANLTGRAFLGTCEIFGVKSDNSLDLPSKDRNVFFEDLGYWVRVDPTSPSEQIIHTKETTTTNDTTIRTNSTMVLKSFSLQP